MTANWNTFKGHGKPEVFRFFEGGRTAPTGEGKVCRAEAGTYSGYTIIEVATGKPVISMGSAGKFWAEPIEEATTVDEAERAAREARKADSKAYHKELAEALTQPAPAAEEATEEVTEEATEEVTEEEATVAAVAATGSEVVRVLEKVWEHIRANHPELPEVVIVTGSGMIGPARWGHFRANGWTERAEKEAVANLVLGEMFVAGETLARGAAHTLETMLHEAAHVLARVRDIKDTSRQNRWHNQKFRALAEELGLEYAKESAHPQIGFSEVTLTPGTTEEYADVIEELDKAIRLCVDLPAFLRQTGENGTTPGAGEHIHHGGRRPKGAGSASNNNIKATCGCPEPRIIRASRKVLEGARITCEECGEAFLDRS